MGLNLVQATNEKTYSLFVNANWRDRGLRARQSGDRLFPALSGLKGVDLSTRRAAGSAPQGLTRGYESQ